jgi:hypothetical protein
MHIVQLLASQLDHETHTKDIDFSPRGIMRRWNAGYAHTKAVLERLPWVGKFDRLSGVVLHENPDILAHGGRIAAIKAGSAEATASHLRTCCAELVWDSHSLSS